MGFKDQTKSPHIWASLFALEKALREKEVGDAKGRGKEEKPIVGREAEGAKNPTRAKIKAPRKELEPWENHRWRSGYKDPSI